MAIFVATNCVSEFFSLSAKNHEENRPYRQPAQRKIMDGFGMCECATPAFHDRLLVAGIETL